MKSVLDASLFFIEYPIFDKLFTTPSVVEELVDLRSKGRYESLLVQGLRVTTPTPESTKKVFSASQRTGDVDKISETDIDVLALALDLGATIYTDDFAVQNVAHELGIMIHTIQLKQAKKRVWKYRCCGCGKYYRTSGECPICGSQIKRAIKDPH